jgi:hypothetical protein
MAQLSDFYHDVRYCAACASYVPYLCSPRASYCAWCGEEVTLFSAPDQARFQEELRRTRTDLRRAEHDIVA